MPNHRLTDIVRRAAGAVTRLTSASDRDLLARFVTDGDADAFAELVRRHGPMVRGVCRRTLGNSHDADDACQATFLVLARKAGAIRRVDAIGSWLYGVARRTALRLRSKTVRRQEAPIVEMPGPDTITEVTWRDGLRVLDEELARLPDAYRAPLVLCYLEGRTQDEAARQLGWTLGAFRGRMERGRARLRARLDRRGVGLAVLAAVLAAEPTAGAVPVGMMSTIVTTATAVAAGEAMAVPAAVAALAEGVLRAMSMTKLSWATGVVAVCGMLIFGGLWAIGQVPGTVPAADAPQQPNPVPGLRADASQRRKSLDNLEKIMNAVGVHLALGQDGLPADIRDKNGKPLLSWRVSLLPALGHDHLFKRFKLDEPWDSDHNRKLLASMPAVFQVMPKDTTHTYYQVFVGPGTPWNPGEAPAKQSGAADGKPMNIDLWADPLVSTLGVVEAGPPVPWTKPADIPFDPNKPVKFVMPFSNEWHVGMMDSIDSYALKPDIAPDILRRLIVKTDGQAKISFGDLLQPRRVDTSMELAALREKLASTRREIEAVHGLLKERADLLSGGTDVDASEELAAHLKYVKEKLETSNRRLRDVQRAQP
jgi:RNA polymerase sigma factor (sigma-70 family)